MGMCKKKRACENISYVPVYSQTADVHACYCCKALVQSCSKTLPAFCAHNRGSTTSFGEIFRSKIIMTVNQILLLHMVFPFSSMTNTFRPFGSIVNTFRPFSSVATLYTFLPLSSIALRLSFISRYARITNVLRSTFDVIERQCTVTNSPCSRH